MIVLGIDQGLANIGYCFIEININEKPVFRKVIKKGVIKTKPGNTVEKRIELIYDAIQKECETLEEPLSLVCMEALFCNDVMRSGRNKSASIVTTNAVTGSLLLLAAKQNALVRQYAPTTVKKIITGDGKADKETVLASIQNIVGEAVEFKTEHDADATAIACTGGFELAECGSIDALRARVLEKPTKKKKKTKK